MDVQLLVDVGSHGFRAAPQPPSAENLFGTTEGQFDIFYGLVWGTRTAFKIGLGVVLISALIGLAIGTISAFYGGVVDEILMRIVDVFMAVPFLIAAMVLTTLLGKGIAQMTIALTAFGWMNYARVIRSEILVPGLDGRRMSKSYGNTVPLFAPPMELKSAIMKIVTGSEPLEAPKEAEGTTVFAVHKMIASEEQSAELARKLRAGNFGWGHAKQELFEVLEAELGPKRERYLALRADEAGLDRVLAQGAERARVIAQQTMERVRRAIGIL